MAAPPESDGEPRVLVVDDEQNVADLYGTWVEMSSEYEVEVVYDGPEAVEAVAGDDGTAAVDAVLLDRRMPGMSGDEVLREIRDRGYDVPVAMVTAVKIEDAPLDADYQEYLTKPVMREDVSRAVRALVAYDGESDAPTGGESESDAEGAGADDGSDAGGADRDRTDAPGAASAGATPGTDDDADGAPTEGEASDDVRATLDSVSQTLDQIQDTVGDDDAEDGE
jgi:CheY-like chemotaxis protein